MLVFNAQFLRLFVDGERTSYGVPVFILSIPPTRLSIGAILHHHYYRRHRPGQWRQARSQELFDGFGSCSAARVGIPSAPHTSNSIASVLILALLGRFLTMKSGQLVAHVDSSLSPRALRSRMMSSVLFNLGMTSSVSG